jgi:ubiquitin-protein ligase
VSAPRLRRLAADYESVRAEFSGHPHVRVEPLGPNRPPEAYRVALRVRGLRLDGNQPVPAEEHQVEIRLPQGYPREKPLCTPLTPLFHPNVRDYYCIQDHWAAGQSLVDTIAKIADMIQFRVYNPASPLDALAARWASQNAHLFPLGNVMLGTPEVEITIGGRSAPASAPAPAPAPASAPDAWPTTELAAVPEEDDADDDVVLVSLRRGS